MGGARPLPLAGLLDQSLSLCLTASVDGWRCLSLGPPSSRYTPSAYADVFPPNSLSPFRGDGRDVDVRVVGQAAATVEQLFPFRRRPGPLRFAIMLYYNENYFNVVFSVLSFSFHFGARLSYPA